MKLTTLRTTCIAMLAATAALPAFPFGIGLQPTTVEMPVQPGERQRQVVNIANVHTEKTISLTLGLADWTLDETGQIELSPPGDTEASAATWVRFSPAFITLKPGEAEQIIVDMAAPARLERSGDHRFALLASTVLPEERAQGSGVWKKYQIATLFYLTAGDASSDPVIKSSGLVMTPEGEAEVGLRIENPGNAHARLEGVVELSAPGAEPQSFDIANLVVLDGGARNYRVPVGELASDATDIKVRLTNIFAPQADGGQAYLPVHSVTGVEAEPAPVVEEEPLPTREELGITEGPTASVPAEDIK